MAQPQSQPRLTHGVVRFYNFLPARESFLDEVLNGMAQPQKSLPSKYMYDARGCELFEKVCELPAYPVARTERGIMRAHATGIGKFLGTDCQLIELGAASCQTTRILIEALQPPLYVLVDIDGGSMKATADSLGQQFPWLNMIGICADYTKPLALPEFVGVPLRKKVVYLPGSKLSHFIPEDAVTLLMRARRMVGTGGALLAGVDLSQGRALSAACEDAGGATAAFNLNLLARINRELNADFQLRRFSHSCVYDEHRGRTEMRIENLVAQLVHVGGVRLRLAQGESIHTEISCRYSIEEFRALAHRAGFEPGQTWIDPANLFSLHGMIAV